MYIHIIISILTLIPSLILTKEILTNKQYYYDGDDIENCSKLSNQSFVPPFKYPDVYRDENFLEEYFGVKVYDPYRWLENTTSEETEKFIYEQNNLTFPYLKCNNRQTREKIKLRLKELFRYERIGTPFKGGNLNYYLFKNSGLQNHSILYRLINDPLSIIDNSTQNEDNNLDNNHNDDDLEVFFDPNKLSNDGTTSLSMSSFSNNGLWWAYGLQKSGSDWNTIRIKSVLNKTDLPDELTNIKFSSLSWTKDNKGFFYSRYPFVDIDKRMDGKHTGKLSNNKLYYHRIGTSQEDDVLVYDDPEQPINRFHGIVSEDGEYLHLFIVQTSEYDAWYFHRFEKDSDGSPIINGRLEFEPIVSTFDANYEYLGNDGPLQYMLTNYKSPNYRLIRVNLTDEDSKKPSQWFDLIPEHSNDVLQLAKIVNNDIIVCHYIRHMLSRMELRNLSDGSLIKIVDLPIGRINSISGKRRNQTEIYFSITSFLMPTNLYRLDLKNQNDEIVLFKKSIPKNFNPNEFITKQIFYKSKNSNTNGEDDDDNQTTMIPLFIVHRKNLILDGKRPTLLYGYGGFNTMMTPHFISLRMILLQNMNGIFALAGIRGGGEYGKKWHHNGKLLKKQNTFNDFISAAEYLIENNYTSSNRLIIEGGSNGGLLVAAVSNQRPDLFACQICRVGVLDMLRYHKFTIGHAWISEYGDPESETYFHYLLNYSPLHNVPKNNNNNNNSLTHYPATLLLTADHDDRVVPLHSYKYIAELQYRLGKILPNTPFMIRIDTHSGHGGGKPIDKIIEDNVDVYSFIINSLSLKYEDLENE